MPLIYPKRGNVIGPVTEPTPGELPKFSSSDQVSGSGILTDEFGNMWNNGLKYEFITAEVLTLDASHNGKIVFLSFDDASPKQVTLPDSTVDPISGGFNCIVVQADAGGITIVQQTDGLTGPEPLISSDGRITAGDSVGISLFASKNTDTSWWTSFSGGEMEPIVAPETTEVGEIPVFGTTTGLQLDNSTLRVDSSGNMFGNGAFIKEITTTTYTLQESDCGKILHFTHVDGCSVTCPGPTALPYSSNIQCVLVQKNTGQVTVTDDAESTVHSSGSLFTSAALDAELALYRYSATDYQLGGERV